MSAPKTLNIMIRKLILFLFLSSLLTACAFDSSSMSEKDMLQIKSTLENLALDNLKDWEPPFHEDRFLQDFTQSNDFRFTVDGFHVNDYEKWKTIVYESMDYDRLNHKHYKHDIIDIQTIVLSINSGIVTVNYIWDYITNDDLHYNTPATVTAVYRFEDNNWRIMNTHVSHGENRLLKE